MPENHRVVGAHLRQCMMGGEAIDFSRWCFVPFALMPATSFDNLSGRCLGTGFGDHGYNVLKGIDLV